MASQQASDVRLTSRQGLLGALAMFALADVSRDTAINAQAQAAQVGTVTVNTAADSTAYAFVFEGLTIAYTSGASATETTIAAGLMAAFRAEPIAGAVASISQAAGVLTITERDPGRGFTLSDSDTRLTAVESATAGDAGDAIEFGRVVIRSGFDGITAKAVLPSSVLTAQVDSYVLTYDASVNIIMEIEVDGEWYSASHTMATDIDTSGAAAAAAINAALPANTVLAAYTSGTDTLSFTAEVNGKAFRSAVSFGPGRDTGAAVKSQTAPVTSDINRSLLGIAEHSYGQEYPTAGATAGEYAAGKVMSVIRRGSVWVSSAETISDGDKVYVETSGASAGKLYKTSSVTRLLLNSARWVRDESSSNNQSLAVVAIG